MGERFLGYLIQFNVSGIKTCNIPMLAIMFLIISSKWFPLISRREKVSDTKLCQGVLITHYKRIFPSLSNKFFTKKRKNLCNLIYSLESKGHLLSSFCKQFQIQLNIFKNV